MKINILLQTIIFAPKYSKTSINRFPIISDFYYLGFQLFDALTIRIE